jgi:serine protease Do
MLKPGTTTELEIWRDRKSRKVTARVVELEPQEPSAIPARNLRPRGGAEPATEQPIPGLSVRPLTPEERRMVETDGTLVVEQVTGLAGERLRSGDIILDVAGTPVDSVT